MNKNICTILVNGSKTECQTIYWNTEDHKLYTTYTGEPVDDYEYNTLDDAIEPPTSCGEEPMSLGHGNLSGLKAKID